MKRAVIGAAALALLTGGLGFSSAVAAPQAISVQGFMVDQACLNGDTVQVDLTAQSESTTRPVRYRWDFTNNGSFDTPANRNPDATAFYGDEINVTARVRARNPQGETAFDTVTFGTLRCGN